MTTDGSGHVDRANEAQVAFADDRAAALLSGHLDELCAPPADTWRRVKQNASRTVYRGEIDGVTIYVKHFHSRSAVHRVLRILGSSDAMREFRYTTFLARHGVATAPALAACADGTRQWLATRAVEPAKPADAWHAEQLGAGPAGKRRIQRAIVELAGMVGRMHAAGIVHRDLHCGNVLVRTDGEDEDVRLVLMDLHRAGRRRRLSRRERAANLAHLFHDRYHMTSRTERLRFLKHYLAAAGAEGSLRGWQVLVEHFAALHTTRQHRQRDRRMFGRGKYFTRLVLPRGWRARVILASKRKLGGSKAAGCVFTPDEWRAALAEPEALLDADAEGAEQVKNSRSSLVVRRRMRIGSHEVDVYVKRSRRKRWWKNVLDCFRGSPPDRAFRLGHALLTRHVATALPLAALERRAGVALRDSILITEAVDAPRLDEFLNAWLAVPPAGDIPLTAPQQRQLAREVLWQLGRLLRRLHDNRFAHRNLKANTLRVRWSPRESPEIVLVGLDGLNRPRVLTARRRFQGLMRLNVSLLKCHAVNRAGRLRMLMGYLRRVGMGRVPFKPYWRMLEDWSARKLRRQINSRRKRQKAARRPRP